MGSCLVLAKVMCELHLELVLVKEWYFGRMKNVLATKRLYS